MSHEPNPGSSYSAHFRRIGEEPRRASSRQHDERFSLLYDELRARAAALLRHENPDHTLQPTALVHEAFLRMADQNRAQVRNDSQALALAALAMRRALVDHARGKKREKRGGGSGQRVSMDASATFSGELPVYEAVDVLTLDAALEKLVKTNPRHAQMIELRFFGGLTMHQISQAMNVPVPTLENDWRMARQWLIEELSR